MDPQELRYLELLSQSFPTADATAAELIRLKALQRLPKGTEFFASDIHGEFEAFSHILRNGSGAVRLKVDETFGDTLSADDKRTLCTLIYYPRRKMEIELSAAADPSEWYRTMIPRLVAVAVRAAHKYPRAKVRDALDTPYAGAIEELIEEYDHAPDKADYYDAIIDGAIATKSAGSLIESIADLIQRLAIDRLHIVGDIYDRGPRPDDIMDMLMRHHSIDIQWGNHDMLWMGASQGQYGCVANVVRICARYGNLSILEDAYGINILPLVSFAQDAYADDPCAGFGLKGNPDLPPAELEMNKKVQKAIAIIQFKVEAALIEEYPGFELQDRNLLDKIDYAAGTVSLDGKTYELTDKVFPTVDPRDPYRLTPQEADVIERIAQAFRRSERLQRHMRFFFEAGSLYKIQNGTLMLHACVPLNEDGSLRETNVLGTRCKGRALYDTMDRYVHDAFFSANPDKRKVGRDIIWYLWLGQGSPLFAKSKMATFELYLIAEKEARKEVKNPFYSLTDNWEAMSGIFRDFGLDPATSRLVCGHVPVKAKDGEDPVKCDGHVLTIDGGFSRAYQPTTGIAGYTLIANSYGFILAAHEPLESQRAAIENETDIFSSRRIVERVEHRTMVGDTDEGATYKQRIRDLEALLFAYRHGDIAER